MNEKKIYNMKFQIIRDKIMLEVFRENIFLNENQYIVLCVNSSVGNYIG